MVLLRGTPAHIMGCWEREERARRTARREYLRFQAKDVHMVGGNPVKHPATTEARALCPYPHPGAGEGP